MIGQTAAALNQPNIITVYEINEFADQIYIAMEYIDGKTLKEKGEIEQNREIIDIAIQLGEGRKRNAGRHR